MIVDHPGGARITDKIKPYIGREDSVEWIAVSKLFRDATVLGLLDFQDGDFYHPE